VIQSRQTPKQAAKKIAARGKTWGDKTSVSVQLWTAFINPVQMRNPTDKLEPDIQPIDENQARSAILFGPPGTSKTTLVRSLADVISWKYVEIHASHFVKQGLAEVQKTADEIFEQLSELDHAVVLFDEIDELVRERDMEKDAFGRFLTTSMLPKLAELWEARKILYFVATNHINYFDNAIIRSHRFDALILVSPPSFPAKKTQLTRLLREEYDLPKVRFQIKERLIQNALGKIQNQVEELHTGAGSVDNETEDTRVAHWREQKLDPNLVLAKFALLRYDEIDELAYRLSKTLKAKSPVPRIISAEILAQALTKVTDSEWRKNKSYSDYLRDRERERRDFQMLNVWEFKGRIKKPIPSVSSGNKSKWLAKAVESLDDIEIAGFRLSPKPRGRVGIQRSK
jgi:hypothetical protein